MTVGSLFAGVGGIDQGFERAGFQTVWQVEIDADASAVLAHRFPLARRFSDIRHVGASACVVSSAARIKRLSTPNDIASSTALAIARANILTPVDWLVGGFPCQDVSIAGKRVGLAGSRTGLFWQFIRLIEELKPKGVALENVPGIFSSNDGRDFHTVLSALADCGLVGSWRVLDSQYFGVPQRRRRVFIVGCARTSGLDPAAILFEPAGRAGHSAPRRSTGPRVAGTLRGRAARAGVNTPGRGGEDDQNLIAFDTTQITHPENRSQPAAGRPSHPLSASAHAPAIAFTVPSVHRGVGNGHNTNYIPTTAACLNPGHEAKHSYAGDGGTLNIVATLNSGGNSGGFRTEPGEHLIVSSGERARALVGSMHKRHDDDTDTLIAQAPIAFDWQTSGSDRTRGNISTERTSSLKPTTRDAVFRVGVRRLTPLECERLQGYPDGWTCRCGKGHLGTEHCTCADTPRYKQCGNGVTAPVAFWIAQRIQLVESLRRA